MEANEIKVNLELMNALIKLREASVVFDEQNTFNHGIYECMDAISKMIGESVVNGVYSLIPDRI